MKRCLHVLSLAAIATVCLGCSPNSMPEAASGRPKSNGVGDKVDVKDKDKTVTVDKDKTVAVVAQAAPLDGVLAAPPEAPAPAEEQPRKIVYNARVELIVEEFDKTQDALTRLVDDYKGYITKSATHGETGTPRSGDWTLRIPAAQFREFVAALAKLGELHDSQTDSDDVTDRYYDLKAHIKNEQAEEEALRKLMVEKSATGKLEELLAIRRELRELRGMIDSQQGQMERWDKDVAMTTVVLQVQERKDYIPATSPSFGTSIYRTFTGSIDALLAFGRGLVLFVAAVAPWLVVLGAPLFGVWWFFRKRLRVAVNRVRTVPPAAPPASA